MTVEDKAELLRLLEEKQKRLKYNKYDTLFPDTGPYRRDLYPRHVEFMNAGEKYPQRAIIAANRVGKTLMGAYEMTAHLTGRYPEWWKGKRFDRPVRAWAAGVTVQVTRDVMQYELYGSPADPGTGMLPKDSICNEDGSFNVVRKPGTAEALETIYVKHVSGGVSSIVFKSYDQKREAFQGTKMDVIWLDEEPRDQGIFTECLTRTAGPKGEEGLIYCTFTPLFGISDVVMKFLPDGRFPSGGVHNSTPYRFIASVSWDDVPHLSEDWKAQALASYARHELDARTKGIPALGSGAIYPYPEAEITCKRFPIPSFWPKCYGFDFGWKEAAAVWIAKNPDTGQLFAYREYVANNQVPAIHAAAIRAPDSWIPGVVDPAAKKHVNVADGSYVIDLYAREGLILELASNIREPDIQTVSQAFATGQLKIFDDLTHLLGDYRFYRRDDEGRIVKGRDHTLDALRYAVVSGVEYACTYDDTIMEDDDRYDDVSRDNITGY